MNKSLYNWVLILTIFLLISCKKDNTTPPSVASFTVINAIANGAPVKADFTGKVDVFTTTEVETVYGRYNHFIVPAGQQTPVKIVSSTNAEEILFNRAFTFQPGDIYSLFLAGEVGNIDTILVKEDITPLTDSTMGIQFINCSPSGPVKIVPVMVDNLGVSIPQTTIPTLQYKERTGFLSYPAPSFSLYYMLEVRDPVTDELLTSIYLDRSTNHRTIAIRGYAGGTPELTRTQVNYEIF